MYTTQISVNYILSRSFILPADLRYGHLSFKVNNLNEP